MKTQLNITNFLTKGFILAVIAVSLMLKTSAQKSQDSVNSEKIASSQIMASVSNGDNNRKANSTAASKNEKSDLSLEEFLIKAAGINTSFTTESDELNESSSTNENSQLEQFLINAAGLNQNGICNENENVSAVDSETVNFLIHAAALDSAQDTNLSSSASEQDNQDADMSDFLVKAAGLNMFNCSNMN